MMFILSILILFVSLLPSSASVEPASASPQNSLDVVNPATTIIIETSTKPLSESKSSKSTYIISRFPRHAMGRDATSNVSTMIDTDDDKWSRQDNSSEWDLPQNETTNEDKLHDASTKSNNTVAHPSEPDTAQSSTLVVLSIFSFLALSLCAATALQRLSTQGSRRHEYHEVGNIVV